MKCIMFATLLALAGASRLVQASPVDKVVELISKLKTTVEEDGKKELSAYDKYACWCEETLATKAADIAKAKLDIESMQGLITKLGAELASLKQDIKQVKKDLAENRESQKETKALRNKEEKSYMDERTEAEQCIGALEAAIKILTGAGASKKGSKFLETLQEAQLMGTLGSLRGVLGTSEVRHHVSEKNLDLVRDFINNPEGYLKATTNQVALIASGNNPFGDYAPQSGQIQGVLKSMYDTFTMDLEKANAEESKKFQAYTELMETKIKEEKALEATEQRTEQDFADKTSQHADLKSTLDHTKEQLEADEQFFAQTKTSCKEKAQAWSERTRLRAEELQGMKTAVAILSSESAKKTFDNATTTFLQLKATPVKSDAAYKQLRALAGKFGGVALAEVAAQVRLGGHFDKVINMIHALVRTLKEEGAEDIKQRERCETEQDKNKKAMEDLNFDIKKFTEKLDRYNDEKVELEKKIKAAEESIGGSNKTINEMKDQRAKEWADFSQATKDDLNAIQLLKEAIVSLSKFYKDNKIETTNLLQADPKVAPTTWEDDNYGGKKSESGGIIAILEMIKEDLEREVKFGEDGDAASNANFGNDLKAAQESMEKQMKIKADADTELAEVLRQIDFRDEDKTTKETDLEGEDKIKKALEVDCAWVDTHFESRAKNRKLEIEGLNEAIHFLQGAVVLPR